MLLSIDLNLPLTKERIIELYNFGLSVEKISRVHKKQMKDRGFSITLKTAREYVEPIIFNYVYNLFKGGL